MRYQACDEFRCLPPRTDDFVLTVPIDTIDVPNLGIFAGLGQKTVGMRSKAHALRLAWRALRKNPRGFVATLVEQRRLEREARARGAQ